MLKAEQGKVIQDSNMFVVNKIRSLEIDFYSSWYMAFGNQALVIAGFALESYSQIIPPNSTTFQTTICYTYWISIILCFSSCAHCSIVCVFSYVYGNGLALRGPAGSVVRAVQGMATDRYEIFNSYVIGVVMLILSTVATYFIMMDFEMALLSSIINILGGVYTYRTCLNIYNRFKLIGGSESKLPFSHKEDRGELDSDSDNEFEDIIDEDKRGDSKTTRLLGPVRKNSGGFFGKLFSFGGKPKRSSFRGGRRKQSGNDMEGFERVSRIAKKVRVKGFMSMRKDDRSKWKRYYFVMVRSNLYYYYNEADWEHSRDNPVKSRPIDLEGYVVSGMSVEPPYQIVISPADENDNRKVWEFQCDTVHEMDAWIRAFNVSSGTRVQALRGDRGVDNDADSDDMDPVEGVVDRSENNIARFLNDANSDRGTTITSVSRRTGHTNVGSNSSNSFYDVDTEKSDISFRSFNG